jgi:ribulose-bisphosphate carboxylase small chain
MAAAIFAKSASAAGVVAKPARASRVAAPKVFAGLNKVSRPQTVQPAEVAVSQAASFMVWQPINNKMFETFSYLPPLTDGEIAQQVDYVTGNGWIPCLEFAPADIAYTGSANTTRMGAITPNYYDNRYWTLWKLPMFGCTDSSQVLREIAAATRAFPDAYIRLVAFDNQKQVQIMGFLVQRPASAKDWKPPSGRSVHA